MAGLIGSRDYYRQQAEFYRKRAEDPALTNDSAELARTAAEWDRLADEIDAYLSREPDPVPSVDESVDEPLFG